MPLSVGLAGFETDEDRLVRYRSSDWISCWTI